MGLASITGVFSRYFVVGFFLPAYIALVALWQSASSEFLPDQLEQYSRAGQLAILGGVALVAAMLLSGLSYYIIQWFEGYPLEKTAGWPVVGWLYDGAIALQRRRYDRLLAVRANKAKPQAERQDAAWFLDRFYPERSDLLLPTRVGNAVRAFERHSKLRWGLDSVTLWPRIEGLLSATEREAFFDAKTNFCVFINGSVGALIVGVVLVVDQAVYTAHPASYWALYAIPFVVGYALYRMAISPATEWGDHVRSAFDCHRLEIYDKLGVRAPTSFSDERALADRVNKALLYGRPLLSDDLWRAKNEGEQVAGDQKDNAAEPQLGVGPERREAEA